MNTKIKFLKVTQSVFSDAWELFFDHKLSFTDCTNVSFLKLYRIEHVATFDKQFKKIKGINVVDG